MAMSPMLNRDLCIEGIASDDEELVPLALDEEPVLVLPAVAVAAMALLELATANAELQAEAVAADLTAAAPLKSQAESAESWPW